MKEMKKQTQPLEKCIDKKLNYFLCYRKHSELHWTLTVYPLSFVLFLYSCPMRNKADNNLLDCLPPLVISSGEIIQLRACLSSMYTKIATTQ